MLFLFWTYLIIGIAMALGTALVAGAVMLARRSFTFVFKVRQRRRTVDERSPAMSQERNPPSLVVTGWWLILTGIAFSMFLGFIIWLLVQWDLLQGTPTGDGTKLIAAVLALVGTVLAGALTFIGLLLRLAQQERNEDLRDEAEKRLKMEAAIRGVGLLSSPATRVAPKAQKAGALLALAKLGQIDFALSLLDELWRKDEVETSTAVWLINQSLKSDDLNTQNDGAEILDSYATRLAIAGHMRWPDHVRGRWPV